jgi:hypothetical protein
MVSGQRQKHTRGGICSGSLTERQITTLQSLAAGEKLAHDVYVALDEKFGGIGFERIASSESRHLEALRRLMARYGVDDPTKGLAAGQFGLESLRNLYIDLVGRATTPRQALAVGATIEHMDIDDLSKAAAEAGRQDLQRVGAHLLLGSQRHLAAFSG